MKYTVNVQITGNTYIVPINRRIKPEDILELVFPEGYTYTLVGQQCNTLYKCIECALKHKCDLVRIPGYKQRRLCGALSPHCVFKRTSDIMEEL